MLTAEEKTVIEKLSVIIPKIPESKKLYLLGIGEGMAVMAEKQKKESTIRSSSQSKEETSGSSSAPLTQHKDIQEHTKIYA